MIKEIFEIEPVQKNSLIVFVGIFCLSFLQLYLFKNDVLESGTFIIIGLCLSLTVCWSIINVLPLMFFFNSINEKEEKGKEETEIILERVVFALGLLGIGWIGILTYIAYELNLCFKDFIRISILVSVVRTLFWFIYGLIANRKKTK